MHKNKKIEKLDDVEDLTNTVFLEFAEEYQNIKNLNHWLRRVLFLTYILYYKKNKVKSSLIRAEAANGSGTKRPAAKMMDINTLKVLSLLGEDKQKIIRLKLWANVNFQLIAENVKKSESEVIKVFIRTLITIKNRLR
jgi:DNA-directed RNA polymerase specialized sigma24 family protein